MSITGPRRLIATAVRLLPAAAFALLAVVSAACSPGANEPAAAPVQVAPPPTTSAAAMPESDAASVPATPQLDVGVEPASAVEPLYVPVHAETEPDGVLAAEAGHLGTPALVMFHADWCHVCQGAMPTVHKLRDEYAGRVAILKMNIDDPASAPFVARYRVGGTPTFVLLDSNGALVERLPGWVGEEQTVALLDSVAATQ